MWTPTKTKKYGVGKFCQQLFGYYYTSEYDFSLIFKFYFSNL